MKANHAMPEDVAGTIVHVHHASQLTFKVQHLCVDLEGTVVGHTILL